MIKVVRMLLQVGVEVEFETWGGGGFWEISRQSIEDYSLDFE